MPVGGGLLYVQPLYTERTGGDGTYPLLRFVVASFGEEVGIGATLSEALENVIESGGGDTGTDATTPKKKAAPKATASSTEVDDNTAPAGHAAPPADQPSTATPGCSPTSPATAAPM